MIIFHLGSCNSLPASSLAFILSCLILAATVILLKWKSDYVTLCLNPIHSLDLSLAVKAQAPLMVYKTLHDLAFYLAPSPTLLLPAVSAAATVTSLMFLDLSTCCFLFQELSSPRHPHELPPFFLCFSDRVSSVRSFLIVHNKIAPRTPLPITYSSLGHFSLFIFCLPPPQARELHEGFFFNWCISDARNSA